MMRWSHTHGEIVDKVRGQHDAHALRGDLLHEDLEELPPGKRIETGHGFVEDEKLRTFGDRHRQRNLGALAAGERTGPLVGIEVELFDPSLGELLIPVRTEGGAHHQVLRDGHPVVDRSVLGEESDLVELDPPRAGAPAEHPDRP